MLAIHERLKPVLLYKYSQTKEIAMNTKRIKKQLEDLQEMLEDMKQERTEASVKYDEDSDFMIDLEEDILLCSLSINDLSRQLITKKEPNNG